MPEETITGSGINQFQPIGQMKTKKKKRKLHGIIFVRNLRPGVKNNFKSVAAKRNDNMANVVEALLMLYTDTPEVVDKYLPEIKENRRRSNKRRR